MKLNASRHHHKHHHHKTHKHHKHLTIAQMKAKALKKAIARLLHRKVKIKHKLHHKHRPHHHGPHKARLRHSGRRHHKGLGGAHHAHRAHVHHARHHHARLPKAPLAPPAAPKKTPYAPTQAQIAQALAVIRVKQGRAKRLSRISHVAGPMRVHIRKHHHKRTHHHRRHHRRPPSLAARQSRLAGVRHKRAAMIGASTVTGQWPMYGNDHVASCGPAATANVLGGNLRVEDLYALFRREAGQGDEGVELAEWLAWLKAKGGHIADYAAIPTTRDSVHAHVRIFGGVLVGVTLGTDATARFISQVPWFIRADSDPERSHALALVDWDEDYDYLVCWGHKHPARIDWAHGAVEEAWVVIPVDDP